MVVILSDDEAENVASILRRMVERIRDDGPSTRMATVDDRGPTDFATQLEALVDNDTETVYVPFERSDTGTAARHAFVTGNDALLYAGKVNSNDARSVDAIENVTLNDPNDDNPDP